MDGSAFWLEPSDRNWCSIGRKTRLTSALTEVEFALRTARALVSAYPDKAANFVVNALTQTVDPRLRHLIQPALAALRRSDAKAARKWIDRACDYHSIKRG